ncbi:MAG: 2,3-bisphosphoglycerate-independent phosphoglycerate mutase [bacterium]|nr:2,3-bisphosphoglycerate-independent phosphoglycerate mutase [bacterium]
MSSGRPVVLVVVDGFGIGSGGADDATALAHAPFFERIADAYPSTQIGTSGAAVGLPDGQMGNSEVGHMTLGAGRILDQDMVRIQKSIAAGELASNPVVQELIDAARKAGGRLHLMGLISDGGVHSSMDHLHGLLDLCEQKDLQPILHAFTDGRDTAPRSALRWIEPIEARIAELNGCIATLGGRYWAMDRDKRWERVVRAYRAITLREGEPAASAVEAVKNAYARDRGDEFIDPSVIANGPALGDGDAVLFFNFRADRARELSNALTRAVPDALGPEILELPALALGAFTSLTLYDDDFEFPAIFEALDVPRSLGEVIADSGVSQLRIAETEKYAHVTYFFSGGREQVFAGEKRVLIPSPRDVPTYDLKPEMSAVQLTDALLEELEENDHGFVLINFANPDMVGHTGVIPACVQAVEVVAACLDRVSSAVLAKGGCLLITSDHGNIEELIDADGKPQTAHTTNPVPLYYLARDVESARLEPGGLADLAATVCHLLDLPVPDEMTGKCLLRNDRGSSNS